MTHRIARWIATCGPIGYAKMAPGSFGSLIAFLPILLVGNYPVMFIFLSLVLLFVAVWASSVTSRELNQKDPTVVVIDEVCGMMFSFILVPIDWKTLLIGFLGFRFFDIVKPPPIRFLERMPAGFGIVLDDVAAGIYTNLVLQILVRYAHL